MKIFLLVSRWVILGYCFSSLIPLIEYKFWWIRVLDFPRLQLLFIGLISGLIYATKSQDKFKQKAFFLGALILGAGLDIYRVLPYSPLWAIQSHPPEERDPKSTVTFLTVNVLQSNEKSSKLLQLFRDKSPDIAVLLEVNQRWLKELAELDEAYKYNVKYPLENEYGIALYSRLPLSEAKVRFLVDDEVPSIKATAVLESGKPFEIFALHPRPPRPQDGPTNERDAELVMIAKEVSKATLPVVVLGDLNDVAWSHTSRLFSRISKLLDPRVGRGPYATFPASLSFLRFPLDYIFHSKEFRLIEIERLGSLDSDHLPIYASFSLEEEHAHEQDTPELDDGDLQEADETIQDKDGKM